MKTITLNNIKDLELLPKSQRLQATITYATGGKEKRRVLNEGDSLFLFENGSKRWGRRFFSWQENWQKIDVRVPEEVDKEIKWRKSLERALKMLKESGLWTDIRRDIEAALDIGYQNIQKAVEIDESPYLPNEKYDAWKERTRKEIEAIDKRLNQTILWHLNRPLKIKKMYFGWQNGVILAEIKRALKDKEKYDSGRIRVNYDVSFYYDPEANRAWYNEEYKDCGNGHYYLALNATHAVFWEDD
jgi:hypothetical protein